jgi:hypothetical protein
MEALTDQLAATVGTALVIPVEGGGGTPIYNAATAESRVQFISPHIQSI